MNAVYICAVKYDLDGEKGFARFFRGMIISAVLVTVVLVLIMYRMPGFEFQLFSAYCGICMLYILVKLFRRAALDRSYLRYIAAVLCFIAGSLLQSLSFIAQIATRIPSARGTVYTFFSMSFSQSAVGSSANTLTKNPQQ